MPLNAFCLSLSCPSLPCPALASIVQPEFLLCAEQTPGMGVECRKEGSMNKAKSLCPSCITWAECVFLRWGTNLLMSRGWRDFFLVVKGDLAEEL